MSEQQRLAASEETMEDRIDEEVFQDIAYTTWCSPLLRLKPKSAMLNALSEHLSKDVAYKFVRRLQSGGDWITDFGNDELPDAICSLSLTTPNKELRRLRDRLHAGIDPRTKDVSICSDGAANDYQIQWYRAHAERISFPGNDRVITTADLDRLVQERDIKESSADQTRAERYPLPEATVMALLTPGYSAVFVPVGTIRYKGRKTDFIVIRMLAREEFWVIYDFEYEYYSIDEGIILPPAKRVATFPGTDIKVSVGILSELFTENLATLRVHGTNGFEVEEALRLGGVLQVA